MRNCASSLRQARGARGTSARLDRQPIRSRVQKGLVSPQTDAAKVSSRRLHLQRPLALRFHGERPSEPIPAFRTGLRGYYHG